MLVQDAWLYALGGIFCLGTFARAVSPDYREWARMAVGPYFAGALLSLVLARRRSRGAAPRSRRPRAAVAVALLLLTVVLPLSLEVVWRAQAPASSTRSQAQPEVAVIERAGDRLAQLRDPYPSTPTVPGVSPASDTPGLDASAFFPYLPGMAVFGLLNPTSPGGAVGDARLALTGATFLIAAGALFAAAGQAGNGDRKLRVAQVLIVLPTGALPLVTGGDDLPVLALMLLGLVYAARRRPVAAGLALGLAATTKFTAWGLLVLLAFGVYDKTGRRAPRAYLLAACAVALPVGLAGFFADPHAFLVNVVLFPLGLTKVHSPAASPMLGQELVVLLPHLKRLLTVLLLGVAAFTILFALATRTPRRPSAVARFTACAIVLVVVVAPATRFGYFIYPANLLVWGGFLRSLEPPAPEEVPDAAAGGLLAAAQAGA